MGHSIDALLKIFTIQKKAELTKHCRTATIYRRDFANFIIACEAGILPWQHRISHRDFTPEHLTLSDEDLEALASSKVGPAEGRTKTAINKVFQTFGQRRLLVGHIFYNADLSDWHFLYFDQRDTAKRGNHWTAGSHVHIINRLWPAWNAESLWRKFLSGNVRLDDSLHIRFSDKEAPSAP